MAGAEWATERGHGRGGSCKALWRTWDLTRVLRGAVWWPLRGRRTGGREVAAAGGGAEAIVQAQAGDDGGWGHRSREMWTDLGRF